MLVSDLRHYLDVPSDAHTSLVRLARQQTDLVRAATTRGAAVPWETAIRCGRRPDRTPCTGTMMVVLHDDAVHWKCRQCADDGVISGWEQTMFDMRGTHPKPTGRPVAVELPLEVLEVMRRIDLFDTNTESLVNNASRLEGQAFDMATLVGDIDDVDQLVDELLVEANQEIVRKRRDLIDVAIAVCSTAVHAART